jgi:hypothetical protein
MGGQKVLAKIFIVDARILYILVVKNSDFLFIKKINYVPFQKLYL